MTYAVHERQVERRRVATIRETIPMSMIGEDLSAGFGEIAEASEAASETLQGTPFAVYYEVGTNEVDVELGFPVTGEVNSGRVHTRTMEARRVASTLHVGPYDEVGPAYEALTRWIEEHDHTVAGPPSEIYLNDPTTGDEPRTEVQLPFA